MKEDIGAIIVFCIVVATGAAGFSIGRYSPSDTTMDKAELVEWCRQKALDLQGGHEFVEQCVTMGWHPAGADR